MRTRLCQGAAIAAFCLSVLGAHASAQGTAAERPNQPGEPGAKATTIVGCLVQGLPGSATAKDGIEAQTAQEYFVRTPTVTVPPGTTVAVGKPGTTSTATSIGTPVGDSFYRVSGLNQDLLRPHVGHRVELQGHLTDNTPGIESKRAKTTQDKDGRTTTTVETRIAIAGVLHATTVKMVSASCQ
ncbi:MAG TPA: hypothetical protein VMO26_06795 [Vicinamibacterales bacterium]|nr:hypothetical protein [Vicinamibacterales bacterium]